MRKDTSPKRTLVVTVGLRRKFLTPNSAQNPKYAKLPSLHHIAIKDERDPENYSVNIGMVVSEHLVSNRNGLEITFGLIEVSPLLCLQGQALTVIFLENALTLSFHLCGLNEQTAFYQNPTNFKHFNVLSITFFLPSSATGLQRSITTYGHALVISHALRAGA